MTAGWSTATSPVPVSAATYIEWPASEVVHFRSYNPDDQVRGLSRLEPLRATLLNEDAARRATTAFWNKGARPGMALTHPANLSQPAMERLKAQFDAVAAGADNTGSTVVLEEGMVPNKLSCPPRKRSTSRRGS
jgi:phage portal protein BeeE